MHCYYSSIFSSSANKTYRLHFTTGNYDWGGTSDVLKVSWSNGSCWTLTPSRGLWKGHTILLTVECDQSPSRIRVDNVSGGNDKANIAHIVVDEPRDADEDPITQKETLCIADFGSAWITDVLESTCVYENPIG